MATAETAWKKSDGPVRYSCGTREVVLGDRILLKGLLRRRDGSVNYVPGLSHLHSEMEHNSLYWVGIAFDDGTFTGVLVDPDTGRVPKKVIFLERGEGSGPRALPEAPFD